MSDNLTIVEWGDLVGGGGFVPYFDPDRPLPGKPFQNAAELLVSEEVCQPPEGTRDSHRHPVWSLRCVQVDSLGLYWCFAVQGRGGAFGRAGSCQFAFAPAHVEEPWHMWARCAELVRPDGRLGHELVNRAPSGAISEQQISGVLTGIAERRPRIVVDGEPVDVAAAIGRLLTVVPVEDVRAYAWITYLLRRPVLSERPTVTGRWPAELATSAAATLVNQWLDTTSGEPSILGQSPRWPEALHRLTEQTMSGGINPAYRRLSGMTDLLDRIVDSELGLRCEDVPAQLDRNPDRLLHGTGPDLIRQWACAQPRDAIPRLLELASVGPSRLEELLLDGLLQANTSAAVGENPALIPPVDERPFTGWHRRLALLLKRRYADRGDRAEFVRRELMASGRPMATRDAVEQATPWLEELGLSPYDPTSSGIFPVATDRIVRDLQDQGYLSDTHRRHLAGAADFAVEACRVVDRLGYVPASAGTELLQVAAVDAQQDEPVVGDLAQHLLWHNDAHRGKRTPPCDAWLVGVLDGDLPPWTKVLLLDVGVSHLTQLGSRPLPAAFLRRALQLQADESGLSDATQQALLRDSAERLRAVPERIEGAPARGIMSRLRHLWRGTRREPAGTGTAAIPPDHPPPAGHPPPADRLPPAGHPAPAGHPMEERREQSGSGYAVLGLLLFLFFLLAVVVALFLIMRSS